MSNSIITIIGLTKEQANLIAMMFENESLPNFINSQLESMDLEPIDLESINVSFGGSDTNSEHEIDCNY